MFKVLIGVDGSTHAQHAIGAVARLARDSPAMEVSLVNVSKLPDHGDLSPSVMREIEEARHARQEELLENAVALARANGLVVSGRHGTSGDVVMEIVALARETGADLIVVGTRGMGALGSLVLGSVALGVVHQAQVPVMLVK
ncbi:MAG: universal stress protein [Hydrogenophaga sp.]|nr:universal stress protein [Hydrogenophaga sp.]